MLQLIMIVTRPSPKLAQAQLRALLDLTAFYFSKLFLLKCFHSQIDSDLSQKKIQLRKILIE